MHYEDFVLQLDASSRGGFRARVVKSPFGEGAIAFTLPAAAGADTAAMGATGLSRDVACEDAPRGRDERPPHEVGAELFRTVFQGQVRTLLDKSRGKLEVSPDLGLRLKIKLDTGDADAGALADLPWELLCDGETDDFFALSRQTSLVRYLEVPRSSQPIPFTPPLRILAVGASPKGLPPLDLAEEERRLKALNDGSSGIEAHFIPHASTGKVREALAASAFNVLHFMGHGIYDRASGEGMLAFEAPDGRMDLVSGRAFATKIRDYRSLGVVVLNACNTARAGGQEGLSPFRGVAAALVFGGVPAVVAMQRPISDRAAIGFSDAFYRHVARGDSIDEALTEGRQAIHSATPEAYEWATPVLFLRIPEGNVFVARPGEPPAPAPVVAAVPAARSAAVAAPAPEPAPQVRPEAPGAAAPAAPRHGPMLKIGAGVASAGLLAGSLYFMIPKAPPVPDATAPVKPTTDVLTTGQLPTPSDPKPKRTAKSDSHHTAGTAAPPVDHQTPSVDPVANKTPQQPVVTTPPPKADPVPTAAPTADLSSLSAQATAITRRDTGGTRVVVSFHNSGSLPLTALLDRDSVVLADNLGTRYSLLGSDLTADGSNRRLQIPAGGTITAHFDFQMPKLGGKSFQLSLATDSGRTVSVGGGTLTLDGPP
jgi:hypothetical protein